MARRRQQIQVTLTSFPLQRIIKIILQKRIRKIEHSNIKIQFRHPRDKQRTLKVHLIKQVTKKEDRWPEQRRSSQKYQHRRQIP